MRSSRMSLRSIRYHAAVCHSAASVGWAKARSAEPTRQEVVGSLCLAHPTLAGVPQMIVEVDITAVVQAK